MRTRAPLLFLLAFAFAAADRLVAVPGAMPGVSASKTGVLVVTGGHGFEKEPFFQVFKDNTDITFQAVEHPNAHAVLTPEAAAGYDVVVLYDMWQPISPEAKKNFTAVLRAGKGLVATHHSLVGYQDWDEYRRIIGGRYYERDAVVDGRLWKASTYKHDERMRIRVADPSHPVTRGVGDFEIVDEVYGGFEVLPDSKPLLTTDHPGNTPTLGWWRTYGPARVVFLQLGHDHQAFENPNYRRLLANAIRWAGGRD